MKETAAKIEKIVSGWNETDGISLIERDWVLEKLRALYEEVIFLHRKEVFVAAADKTVEPIEEETPAEEAVAEESAMGTEPAPCEKEEPAGKHPIDRRAILSLYENEKPISDGVESSGSPSSEEKAGAAGEIPSDNNKPDAGPRPEVPPPAILGELLGGNGKTTVSDTFEREASHTDLASKIAAGQAAGLRQAIGLNDKFLLVRDLFHGDQAACDAAIDTLDALPDMDEAMIYLHEHYAWNPNSEGVKLLVELLTRKFS